MKRFILFLLTPFTFLFGLIVVEGYNALFGWWLDKRVAKKNEDRFKDDILRKLAFLFSECGGTIVPNDASLPFPPGFDNAVVTVVAGNVRFQFLRGRGEFRVDVAPQHDPTDMNEISTVLRAIGAVEGPQTQPLYQEPREFARLLRTHLIPCGTLSPRQNIRGPKRIYIQSNRATTGRSEQWKQRFSGAGESFAGTLINSRLREERVGAVRSLDSCRARPWFRKAVARRHALQSRRASHL